MTRTHKIEFKKYATWLSAEFEEGKCCLSMYKGYPETKSIYFELTLEQLAEIIKAFDKGLRERLELDALQNFNNTCEAALNEQTTA